MACRKKLCLQMYTQNNSVIIMQFESDEFNYFIYFVLFLKTLVEYKLTHFISCGVINEWVCLPTTLFISRNNFYFIFFILHFIIYLFHYIKGSERNMRSIKRTKYAIWLDYYFRLEIMITLYCGRIMFWNAQDYYRLIWYSGINIFMFQCVNWNDCCAC